MIYIGNINLSPGSEFIDLRIQSLNNPTHPGLTEINHEKNCVELRWDRKVGVTRGGSFLKYFSLYELRSPLCIKTEIL